MAKTRKDSRGYALKTGESQRKDGRYSYSWTDRLGERKVIYAKTIQELRLKERKIIISIKYTDVKKFYYGLIQDDGLSSATLDNVHTVMHCCHGCFQVNWIFPILTFKPLNSCLYDI